MKCERCKKDINYIITGRFDITGKDYTEKLDLTEYEVDAVGFDTDRNWVGYDLTEKEQRETIECPHCHKYPFKNKEIQVYEIVRVIGFKEKEGENK